VSSQPPKPLVERLNARLRNNPIVAVAIVVGTIVIAIASFTDATSKLIARFSKPSPASARAALGQLNLPYTTEAFVASAGAGDASAVQLYLTAGMDPNSIAPDGSDALGAAAFNGRAPVVTLLLDAGAHIADAMAERSALYSAARSRHNDILQLLVARHPDRKAIDSAFAVAMRRKAGERSRNLEGARLLAAAGADVRGVAPEVFTRIWSEGFGDEDAVLATRTLLDLGAVLADMDGVDGKPVTALTPLMGAATEGYAATVDLLLAQGARVDTRVAMPGRHENGSTALICAARGGSPAVVRALLAKGARKSDTDETGMTALDWARRFPSRAETPELVRLLK